MSRLGHLGVATVSGQLDRGADTVRSDLQTEAQEGVEIFECEV